MKSHYIPTYSYLFCKEGDSVVGTVVQIYCPGGVSVDVGCCDTLAFLEVEAGGMGLMENPKLNGG